MNRIAISPRHDWPAKVEEIGLTYHTPEGRTYWDESAYYQFNAAEVDILEKAGNDLHAMCIQAAQHVIDENLFDQLGIPADAVPFLKNSWERDDFSVYGRFDFIFDGRTPPKMLEYNADTPTALVEAAVAQWYWLQDFSRNSDQFNSIHEKLVAAWKQFGARSPGKIHFGGIKECPEDEQTVLYVQDTCHQAGLATSQLYIEDIGCDRDQKRFVDLENQPVRNYFKLYPWEWMWHEEFSFSLKWEACNFVEPMWKMLLSNKGLLPILWKLYPGHPNLLPAFFSADELTTVTGANAGYVKKPKLSREGANVSIVLGSATVQTNDGDYGEEGFIYQALAPLAEFDGNHPVCGVWIVNHEACGLGIREDRSLITGNLSRFVPHLF
jgi:glutathionylspermidine synthase